MPPDAPPAPVSVPIAERWRDSLDADALIRLGVVGLAAFLRLFWLAERPPHFDEGVNGWFTDQMQTTGFYKYDPSNYHGPLHFYVLFLFKCLLGRNLWALRLPVALVGIVTVDWCFRFRAFFGRRTCAWAALAMALSPGTLFFQRDAIHETWLLFFLVLAFWGICGLWQEGGKRHLWGLALGITGAILTKETYLVHFACFGAAVVVLWQLEEYLPSTRRPLLATPAPTVGPNDGEHALWNSDDASPRYIERFLATCAPQRYRTADVWIAIGVCLALIVFFYSGNFYNWDGLNGLVSTFRFWGKKAHEGEGHNKPFIYWTNLVLTNEPWAAVGILACLRYVVPPLSTTRHRWSGAWLIAACLAFVAWEFSPEFSLGPAVFGTFPNDYLSTVRHWTDALELRVFDEKIWQFHWALGVITVTFLCGGVSCLALPLPADWRLRLLAIYAPGTLLAYSIIPYKTPWCAISFIWPFFFATAAVGVELAERYARPAVRRGVGWAGAALAGLSAWWMTDLNYVRPTDDKLSYVYVQTFNDMWKITNPLLALARDDPSQYHLRGVILCGSTYPLPWVLGDFTGIGYHGDKSSPAEYRADFLLVEDTRIAEAEEHLDDVYFKESVHLRPAQNELVLYLRASLFGPYVKKGREPEFRPPVAEVPSGVLPPGEVIKPEE